MTLRLTDEERGRYTVLRVVGEVDYSNCAQMSERAEKSFTGGQAGLIVDLLQVSYLDSQAIGRLLYIREQAAKAEKGLALVPDPLVEEMLQMAGLAHLFVICRSVEEAAERLAGG